ncbi:MAG: Smr/MutS family protein [Sphingomonadaceae bacterium]
MRRLSPEERALWHRFARTVRTVKPVLPEPPSEASQAAIAAKPALRVSAALPTRKPARLAPQPSNTLDGSWDKRIGAGRIVPERTIDLHGHTLASAHRRLETGLADAVRDGVRTILLVTGRPPRAGTSRLDLPLRGIIRASVGDWLATSRHACDIAAVRAAHPRHGGAGALYIVLRRQRD